MQIQKELDSLAKSKQPDRVIQIFLKKQELTDELKKMEYVR